ncbi:hypothetical protein GQ651_02305 [Alphaproteobacteria bacterium GH1-50]|uniref:Cytochrome c domain-containing protein n=1 Tax=Kangsaoukella pontilimi TaxID=2691042 RepID=A0A7C9MB88_9RHOB|nr:hypothetical protein [Kangsaoukella pontilimi]MXQ06671.1 hypothetical protein [Kangsaoukella pontilimi]
MTRFKIPFGAIIAFLAALILAPAPASAQSADLTLEMPEALIALGFDKQILPRFGFKHRIRVTAVAEGPADMRLSSGGDGAFVFRDAGGADYLLDAGSDPRGETFLGWLNSAPGQAAVESFAPEGRQMFFTEIVVKVVQEEEVFDGDTRAGSDLALLHCGRCHVVDSRNRMGGIGSSPSFAALRARGNWSELFRAFYVHNPHPSFTQVEGVTEPFDPNRQVHVAKVEITLEDVEAITAFVATIEPKDLGRPVQSN